MTCVSGLPDSASPGQSEPSLCQTHWLEHHLPVFRARRASVSWSACLQRGQPERVRNVVDPPWPGAQHAVPTPGWSPARCGQRGGISHHPRHLRSLFILLGCDLFLKRSIGPSEHLNLSFMFTLNKTSVPCEIGNRTAKPEVPVASAARRPRTGLI